MTIRVVVADDHPVVRDGLLALFSSLEEIEVVGVAANGREAVRAAATEQPNVAILDIQMPEMDGISATREIVRAAPGVNVLVMSVHDDDHSVFAAMRAGARGYIVKGAEPDEIVRAVLAVARGEAIFSPGVATLVLRFLSAPPSSPSEAFPELTPGERRILDLIAAGHSNREIAKRLSLSPKTIANNVSSIFSKLQVADRAGAIVRARDAGLGRASD